MRNYEKLFGSFWKPTPENWPLTGFPTGSGESISYQNFDFYRVSSRKPLSKYWVSERVFGCTGNSVILHTAVYSVFFYQFTQYQETLNKFFIKMEIVAVFSNLIINLVSCFLKTYVTGIFTLFLKCGEKLCKTH